MHFKITRMKVLQVLAIIFPFASDTITLYLNFKLRNECFMHTLIIIHISAVFEAVALLNYDLEIKKDPCYIFFIRTAGRGNRCRTY